MTRAGRFSATGLAPGRYEVRIDHARASMTIAVGVSGLVNLGDVTLDR